MEKELAHQGKKGPGLQASVCKSILSKVESEKENLENNRVANDDISDLEENQAGVYIIYTVFSISFVHFYRMSKKPFLICKAYSLDKSGLMGQRSTLIALWI